MPWLQPWPNEDLETVGCCPVCHSTSRSIWHDDLVDGSFRTAPGQWRLWRCAKCSCAYLDPRPTPQSIGRCYANYYTHQPSIIGPEPWHRRVLQTLANGYLNRRYGTQAKPASGWGPFAAALAPSKRRMLDRQFRHLEPSPSKSGLLLDVGCGSGEFLKQMKSCGWQVLGVEPDPTAARIARSMGLEVHHGTLESLQAADRSADAITLSHVIEHVHDPLRTLQTCHRLLKPGGRLWMETPHVNCLTHAHYRQHWRGLEAPRHLVLYSRPGLTKLLHRAGFESLRWIRGPDVRWWLAQQSESIRQSQPLDHPVRMPLATLLKFGPHTGMTPMAEPGFLTVMARTGKA